MLQPLLCQWRNEHLCASNDMELDTFVRDPLYAYVRVVSRVPTYATSIGR